MTRECNLSGGQARRDRNWHLCVQCALEQGINLALKWIFESYDEIIAKFLPKGKKPGFKLASSDAGTDPTSRCKFRKRKLDQLDLHIHFTGWGQKVNEQSIVGS
jgi:hypothetical protein